MVDSAGESMATPHDFEVAAGRVEIADVPNRVVDGILTGASRMGTGSNAFGVGVPDELLVVAADGSESLTGSKSSVTVARNGGGGSTRGTRTSSPAAEGYTRKRNAQKGLRRVMENSAQQELTETITN